METNNAKDIAEELDLGFCAYIHKSTRQIIYVPDESQFQGMEMENWKKEIKLLEKNSDDYFEIEKWTTRESFNMMEEFVEQLTKNKPLQSKLFDALNKKKPFREFKWVIDNSGDYRQKWFDFKDKWQQNYVERQLIKEFESTVEEKSSPTSRKDEI